jgi:hypothetical protein
MEEVRTKMFEDLEERKRTVNVVQRVGFGRKSAYFKNIKGQKGKDV